MCDELTKKRKRSFQKLSLQTKDTNLGYVKYHPIAVCITAMCAIKIIHPIQYMFRDMRILRIIKIILKIIHCPLIVSDTSIHLLSINDISI